MDAGGSGRLPWRSKSRVEPRGHCRHRAADRGGADWSARSTEQPVRNRADLTGCLRSYRWSPTPRLQGCAPGARREVDGGDRAGAFSDMTLYIEWRPGIRLASAYPFESGPACSTAGHPANDGERRRSDDLGTSRWEPLHPQEAKRPAAPCNSTGPRCSPGRISAPGTIKSPDRKPLFLLSLFGAQGRN
jgi:hypothetical protein